MAFKLLDLFSGEGGASWGYSMAGFYVFGVDNDPDRLGYYPFAAMLGDAVELLWSLRDDFDAFHASPPCTGYSRATSAIPDRLTRYDRLIPVIRDVLDEIGKPYVIENVYDARKELKSPQMLCGRQFGLTAKDEDGTTLTLDRHRMFETNWPLRVPAHPKHGWHSNQRDGIQVAGSYGGARRDKVEAREVRKGGYVPKSVDVQRELLGTPWMSEKGCWLSIPPAYSEYIGKQLHEYLEAA